MYISDLASRLVPDARITVLTGAGVSAASGVPTFRGADGLWNTYRPEELATPSAFGRDPQLVWRWYDWRRRLISRCRPNRAHDVLAAWSHQFPGFTLITQNVDGLHEAAGTRDLIRLHGSIWHVRCSRPCEPGSIPWLDEDATVAPAARASTASQRLRPAWGWGPTRMRRRAAQRERAGVGPRELRKCPHCGGLLRPAVVWFGESLDALVVQRASAATRCDVFLAVGTSSVVYPAAGLLYDARRRGAFTVEINPTATEASDRVDLAIAQPAEIALDALDRQNDQRREG